VNALEGWVDGLGRDDLTADVVELDGADWSRFGADAATLAYAGLAHLLATRLPAEDRERVIARLDGVLLAHEGKLRYRAFELASRAEHLERSARMQGAEVRATRDWLLPRLEADIDRYGERIRALRALLEAPGA
jgi:hypothetical protein